MTDIYIIYKYTYTDILLGKERKEAWNKENN